MKKPIIFVLCLLCLLSCIAVNAPIHSDVKSLLSYKKFLDIFFKEYGGYKIHECGTNQIDHGFGENDLIYEEWKLVYGHSDESYFFNNYCSFFHQLEGIYSSKLEKSFKNDDWDYLSLNNLSQIDFIGDTYKGDTYKNNIKKIKVYDQYIEQHYKEIYGPDFFALNTPIHKLFQHKNLLFLIVGSSKDNTDKILIDSIPHLNAIIFKNRKIDIFECNDTIENLENFLQYCTFIVDGKVIRTEYLFKHKEKNLLEVLKENIIQAKR